MIRRLKKEFGSKWRPEYEFFVSHIRAEKDGPLIGSLQEIMDAQRNVVR